jgi:hypothetical protein
VKGGAPPGSVVGLGGRWWNGGVPDGQGKTLDDLIAIEVFEPDGEQKLSGVAGRTGEHPVICKRDPGRETPVGEKPDVAAAFLLELEEVRFIHHSVGKAAGPNGEFAGVAGDQRQGEEGDGYSQP